MWLLAVAAVAWAADPLGGAVEIAWSDHAALVRVEAGVVAMSNEHGVLGFVEAPISGTPLLGTSAVFVARGKQLWAADSLEDAVDGDFQLLTEVAGARSWDATPGLVAAITGSDVWISRDEGRSGTKSRPPAGDWARVFVGQDLVVVEDADHEQVAASADFGKTWNELPHPGAPLEKVGGVVASAEVALDGAGGAFRPWTRPQSTWSAWLALSGSSSGTWWRRTPIAASPRAPDPSGKSPISP
jgi:hypothetical protein